MTLNRNSARKEATFTPDLSLLDGMIHSIEVVSPMHEQVAPQAGWASYANAEYGLSFRCPSAALCPRSATTASLLGSFLPMRQRAGCAQPPLMLSRVSTQKCRL